MYIVFIFYCSGCIYQTILKSRDRRGGERAREIDTETGYSNSPYYIGSTTIENIIRFGER